MLGTAKPSGVIFFGTKGEDRNSFVSIHRNKFAVQKQRLSDGAMKNAHKGRQKTRKRAERKVKQAIRLCWQRRIPIYLPLVAGETGNNGLPGQTVKGRGCKTEEEGCFGMAEAPDDDYCNPAHVWNFSFRVYP